MKLSYKIPSIGMTTDIICSICRKDFPILSSFMTCHGVYNQLNTTCVTSRTGTAYPSATPEFTPGFSEVRVFRSLVFCSSLLSFFFVLSVLRFTDSDYPIGEFRLSGMQMYYRRITRTMYINFISHGLNNCIGQSFIIAYPFIHRASLLILDEYNISGILDSNDWHRANHNLNRSFEYQYIVCFMLLYAPHNSITAISRTVTFCIVHM